MKKLSLKLISVRSIFICLGVGAGLLVMAQFRTVPDRITNPQTPILSLRETRDMLYGEQKQLSLEADQLQTQNSSLQEEIKAKSSSQDEINRLEKQKAIAGMTDMEGPGIMITLDDSSNTNVSDESIAHAADLRDILNLLWSSGAEAVTINDQRIVFTTAVDCIVNTILINNTRISTPFLIKAIGDQSRLNNAFASPLNLADIKLRSKSNGLVFRYANNAKIQTPAFKGSFILSTESK